MKAAYALLDVGHEDQAQNLLIKAFDQHAGCESDLLQAIHSTTKNILDESDVSGPRWESATKNKKQGKKQLSKNKKSISGPRWESVSEDVLTRHLLFDKMRDLRQWLQFLTQAGTWSRLNSIVLVTNVDFVVSTK